MRSVKESIEINAPADVVYDIAKNSEEFPKFMPDVKKVEILEEKENGVISRWTVEIDGTSFIWKEEDIYDDDNLTITFKALEGDVDKFEGYWKIIPEDSKSLVELFVAFDINMPGLAALILPTLERKLRENVRSMLQAVKEKAESTQRGG